MESVEFRGGGVTERADNEGTVVVVVEEVVVMVRVLKVGKGERRYMRRRGEAQATEGR